VTTPRVVRDQIQNVLDYLTDAELVLYANEVSMSSTAVSWHAHDKLAPFLNTHDHPDISQYLAWVASGAYSAVLMDGSLLQMTYEIEGGDVSGHRLAYLPCPYDIETSLLQEGEAILDVVELYRDSDAILRSPIRFDYAPKDAKDGHPAVHFTVNASCCRIACVAPLHVLRFSDFVFRHFYRDLWTAHRPFFEAAAWQHVGSRALVEGDYRSVHLSWDVHASATGGSVAR
jgi:hypothetical protein